MRNLASVVTVEKKQKMWQKDKICCVSFVENGYEAIVPNIVNVGDKLIFIQEGSILPEVNAWEFLRKRCWREDLNGFLIKPMTMGKKENPDGTEGDRVKSWGLAVGLHETTLTEGEIRRLKAGDDVTEALEKGITDWSKLKNIVKDGLSDYIWKKTKRRPMIMPIIMDTNF